MAGLHRARGVIRPPEPASSPGRVLDRREADPRRALATAAAAAGASLASLSRMLRQPPRYLDTFVRDGRPLALPASEHRILADHFGLDERGLGVRELWVPLP